MRIVAGYHRSRALLTPEDKNIRPTADRVRQALFNALQHRGAVGDAVVLDAFCGTGALGFEALSQGAKQAVFIDRERSSLDLAQKNAVTLKETEKCIFLHQDTTKISPRPQHIPKATLCFFDPPYRKNLLGPALTALKDNGWLEKNCWIVAEMEKELFFMEIEAESEKIYGETKIIIGRI